MTDHRYTEDHEFVIAEGDVATVGITTHAAEQLGDVVFVELPEVGRQVKAGEAVAVVESVKAASDVFAPVSGEVVAINEDLPGNPEWINQEAEGKAWFFKIKLAEPGELDKLLDKAAYDKLANSDG